MVGSQALGDDRLGGVDRRDQHGDGVARVTADVRRYQRQRILASISWTVPIVIVRSNSR